jgi:hypothetical protein
MTLKRISFPPYRLGNGTSTGRCWKPRRKWISARREKCIQGLVTSAKSEVEQVAEIEWKGVIWRAAYGSLSVKELLTILKGFGPMEILEFEKPGCFRGQMSLSLSKEDVKEITLYYLEVLSGEREGQGRAALQWLKKTFKGPLFVEDPGAIQIKNSARETQLFWLKMYREGLVDAINGESNSLDLCGGGMKARDVEGAPVSGSRVLETEK